MAACGSPDAPCLDELAGVARCAHPPHARSRAPKARPGGAEDRLLRRCSSSWEPVHDRGAPRPRIHRHGAATCLRGVVTWPMVEVDNEIRCSPYPSTSYDEPSACSTRTGWIAACSVAWHCFDGTISIDDLVDELQGVFLGKREEIRGDLVELARTFGRSGLLQGVRPVPRPKRPEPSPASRGTGRARSVELRGAHAPERPHHRSRCSRATPLDQW